MPSTDAHTLISEAIAAVEKARSHRTGGKWLEEITVKVGPWIKDWDISRCYSWKEWSLRSDDAARPLSHQDIGIDCVAVRRSDGAPVAIQCKARRIDQHGNSAAITKKELDSFGHVASSSRYKERWLITNGAAKFSPQAESSLFMADADHPIKLVNIFSALVDQQAAMAAANGVLGGGLSPLPAGCRAVRAPDPAVHAGGSDRYCGPGAAGARRKPS